MPSADPARPRVLLIGCGPTALTALDSLAEKVTVVGVIRDHDPAIENADEVRLRAGELGIPVSGDITVRGIDQLVDQLRPDGVVVSSYNRVLPARLVERTRFVNVHYSPLPRYRGRANVNWAIINGETETAISIHVLAPGLDAGNILFQEPVPIGPADTVTDLYNRLNALQRKHLGSTVAGHLAGEAGRPQNESEASYGCTRLPRDGEIDWTAPTTQVYALIRALTPPYPGAFTYLGLTRLTIWRAELLPDPPRYDGRIPGRVIRVSRSEGWVEVLTGDGVLRIHEIQPIGGSCCPAAEVLGSVKLTLGLKPADLVECIRALKTTVAELRAKLDSGVLVNQENGQADTTSHQFFT
jgi:methionyl-tRNA formyltransferase